MDSFPRTEMLAPELKDPEQPSLITQCNIIKNYILLHYQNDPNNFNSAFNELDDMRNKMLQGIDEHELILVLKRYYAQLVMMRKRFPMELNGSAAIKFTWTERSSDNPLPIVIPDINFEICCVMFNIGCLHAIIATSQQRKDENSIKTAFMHFQQAAWPFICLRDELNAKRCGLADFDDISLTFYANVMLAQAQECILEKSLNDKRSSAIICQIAYRIFQLYESCGMLINNPGFADIMSSSRFASWNRLCSIKGAIYGVIYFHARGQDFSQDQKHGAALSCFKAGLDLANEVMPLTKKDKRNSLKESLTYVKDVITQREQISRKENDLIYHERIPAVTELEKIKGVDMVKAILFTATDPSIAGEDLFKELLPSSVMETVSVYEEAKAELRRKVLNKCEQMDNELESFLLTLKLDKLNLDQPGDMQRLPDELLSCYSEFNLQPDCVQNLFEKFHELTTKTSTVDCQLADMADRMCSVRTPQFAQSNGYKAIANELAKLTEQHKQARSNNTELQKRLDVHTDNLKLFALSVPELTNEVSGKVIDTSKSPEGQLLRHLLSKVDEMRSQRIRLISELREALDKDDITPRALIDPFSDPKSIIDAQLSRHDKHIAVIDQNLSAQANILKALTEANANFADFRKQITDTIESKKSKAITLITAFETFKQIRNNTDKAINFYENMLKLLSRIGEGIRNMEEAKKEDDEEQRILIEKEQQKLQSVEVANFVNEFTTPSTRSTLPKSYEPNPIYNLPMQPGKPKLGDFLRNRNKGLPSSLSASNSLAQVMPQTGQQMPSFGQKQQYSQISTPYQAPVDQPAISINQQISTSYQAPVDQSTISASQQISTPYQASVNQPSILINQQIPQMALQPMSMSEAYMNQNFSRVNQQVPSVQQPAMSTSQCSSLSAGHQPFCQYQQTSTSQPAISQQVASSSQSFQPLNENFPAANQPYYHQNAQQFPASQVVLTSETQQGPFPSQMMPAAQHNYKFSQTAQNQAASFIHPSLLNNPSLMHQPSFNLNNFNEHPTSTSIPQQTNLNKSVQSELDDLFSSNTPATNNQPGYGIPATNNQPSFSAPATGNQPNFHVSAANNQPGFNTPATNNQPGYGILATNNQSGFSTPADQQNKLLSSTVPNLQVSNAKGSFSPWHTSSINPLLMSRKQ